MPFISPIGIPNPANYFGALHPIDAPKPVTTAHCPGWHEPTIRDNTRALGDARDAYYIDRHHPASTDSSNTYGRPDMPRKTVPNKVYTAGDYIEIHGDGNPAALADPYSTLFNPRGVGTDADPIWFVGVNRPVFTGLLHIGYSNVPKISYLVFDGLEWRGGGRPFIRPKVAGNPIDHIVWRDCKAIGTGTTPDGSGYTCGGYQSNGPDRVEYVVWHGGEIANWGSFDSPGEECCIYVSNNVSWWWMLDCDIHHAAEDGMQFSHGGNRSSDHLFVGRNLIHENLTNAIDVKGTGKAVVFSQNEIWGHQDVWVDGIHKSTGVGENATFHYAGNSSGPDFYDNYPEEIWFIFNTCRDGRFGVTTSSCGYLGVIGNTFYQNRKDPSGYTGTPYCIDLRGTRGNSWILNNTFYDCEGSVRLRDYVPSEYDPAKLYYGGSLVNYNGAAYVSIYSPDYPNGMTGIDPSNTTYWEAFRMIFHGNIIAANYAVNGALDVLCDNSAFFDQIVDWNYNCVFNPNGGPQVSGMSLGASDITTDPMLANPGIGDFSLQSGSPCIDAGIESIPGAPNGYDFYFTRIGESIRMDRNGGARPFGAGWDIGAYEFGAAPPPPAAPVNTTLPSISGTALTGFVMTGAVGSWTGNPSPAFSRKWLRCDAAGNNPVEIAGATSANYALQPADAGSTLRVQVTAANSEGSVIATSDPSAVIAVAPPVPVFSTSKHIVPG